MFGPDLTEELCYVALVARRLGGGLLARPAVRLPAGGTELTGYRDYAPGDDYRAVDWRICARHDELLVRQFHGEADRHVYVLLDSSPSMALGRPAKFDPARQAVAALAYVAMVRGEHVRLLTFASRLTGEFGPLADKNHIVRLLRFLQGLSPQAGGTDLAQVASEFVRRDQRRGLAVVVSDFYDRHGFQAGLDILRRAGYAPRIVQVHDPSEAERDVLGDVELVDVETGTRREVTITERHLAAYRRRLRQHVEAIARYCAKYACGYVRLASTLPRKRLLLEVIQARG